MNNKVFISCAVTGSGDTAAKHPDLPKTPEQIPTDIEHEQKNPRNEGSHKIKIFENTKLYSIVNTKQMFVNSAHHQSVKKLGKDLLVNAKCPDGVIEGIEHKSHKFCLGVQWHPEFLIDQGDKNIFSAFIKASSINI